MTSTTWVAHLGKELEQDSNPGFPTPPSVPFPQTTAVFPLTAILSSQCGQTTQDSRNETQEHTLLLGEGSRNVKGSCDQCLWRFVRTAPPPADAQRTPPAPTPAPGLRLPHPAPPEPPASPPPTAPLLLQFEIRQLRAHLAQQDLDLAAEREAALQAPHVLSQPRSRYKVMEAGTWAEETAAEGVVEELQPSPGEPARGPPRPHPGLCAQLPAGGRGSRRDWGGVQIRAPTATFLSPGASV